MEDKRNFKDILDLRDFCIRILLDHKHLSDPKPDFFMKALKSFIKEKGFTKISSRNSLAYLKDRVVFMKKPGAYVAFFVDVRVRKRPVIYATSFTKIIVEDFTYYVGSIKDKDSVMIFAPHFFHRYRERTKCDSLDDAIVNFMGYLLAAHYDEFPIPGSTSGEVLVKFSEGVGFGHKTGTGIQGKDVVFYKTFVTHEMLTEEQRALVEVKKP